MAFDNQRSSKLFIGDIAVSLAFSVIVLVVSLSKEPVMLS